MTTEQELLEKWRAAALSLGAEEFFTTEKSTKPMHRVKSIKVVSIFDRV